jgi:two-component system nitrate/nitrite response regulator NarL
MNEARSSIKILVAADVRFYRDGLAQQLAGEDGVAVVGSAVSGQETVAQARDLEPDIVLLDVAMPDALATVRTLCRTTCCSRIVGLAVPETEQDVIAYAEAGMHGYVSQGASFNDLVATVRSVASGELLCSPRVAAVLRRRVAALAAAHRLDAPLGHLTLREFEIVQLLDEGLSNKEIARHLCIEVSTVKNHVHHILDKLRVHRRGQAAARVRTRLPHRTILRKTEP